MNLDRSARGNTLAFDESALCSHQTLGCSLWAESLSGDPVTHHAYKRSEQERIFTRYWSLSKKYLQFSVLPGRLYLSIR